jgi:molybdopterin-guanine dinucleotide biosynthesis protein A
VTSVTGYVLAGGESRRMGCDKALLPWGDGTLLGHAIARLRRVCADVAVACGPTPRYEDTGARVITDVIADAGPLAGLVSVLAQTPTPLALVLAVDLPFATPELLRFLVESAGADDAVVPVTDRGPHPLCAVYRTTCLSPARRRLDAGEYKMTAFWPDVRVREVPEAALTPFGDPAHLLSNLNSLKDYQDAAGSR